MAKDYRLLCKDLDEVLLTIACLESDELRVVIEGLVDKIDSGDDVHIHSYKVKVVEKFLKGPREILDSIKSPSSLEEKNKIIDAVYDSIISIYPGISVKSICDYNNEEVFFKTKAGKRVKQELKKQAEKAVEILPKRRKSKIDSIESKEDIKELEEYLRSCIIGQDKVITEVIKSVKFLVAGITKFRTILFIGKSGVGKTEVARILGEKYSGNFLKINCGEYSHGSEWTKLVGTAPGYVGYSEKSLLKEKAEISNKWVFIFDEIEKAGPKFYDFLLSLFDDGIITDNAGEELDFSESIFILTSNIGTKELKSGKQLGFNTKVVTYKDSEEDLIKSVTKHFPPEFIGRIHDTIIFNELTEDDYKKITSLALSSCLPIQFGEEVVTYILSKHTDRTYGARGIMKLVYDEVGSLVAETILDYKVPAENGTLFKVIMQEGKPIIVDTKEFKRKRISLI